MSITTLLESASVTELEIALLYAVREIMLQPDSGFTVAALRRLGPSPDEYQRRGELLLCDLVEEMAATPEVLR
jgi:hypothetical protein